MSIVIRNHQKKKIIKQITDSCTIASWWTTKATQTVALCTYYTDNLLRTSSRDTYADHSNTAYIFSFIPLILHNIIIILELYNFTKQLLTKIYPTYHPKRLHHMTPVQITPAYRTQWKWKTHIGHDDCSWDSGVCIGIEFFFRFVIQVGSYKILLKSGGALCCDKTIR